MSGRGVWAEQRPVAFCRARFSFTGVEKGDLTFARDEVLLACPLWLAAFVHRSNASNTSGKEEAQLPGRGRAGSGGATVSNGGGGGTTGKGVRWVLAIHPDGECGRIPANYVLPLEDEEVKRLVAQGTLGQLSSLHHELQCEVAEERKPLRRRGSDAKKEKRHAKETAAGRRDSCGEVETKAARSAAATTTTQAPPDVHPAESSDSQLQRLIQQKLKTFEDDVSGTLKFYQNMRRGVQSLFEQPGSDDCPATPP